MSTIKKIIEGKESIQILILKENIEELKKLNPSSELECGG